MKLRSIVSVRGFLLLLLCACASGCATSPKNYADKISESQQAELRVRRVLALRVRGSNPAYVAHVKEFCTLFLQGAGIECVAGGAPRMVTTCEGGTFSGAYRYVGGPWNGMRTSGTGGSCDIDLVLQWPGYLPYRLQSRYLCTLPSGGRTLPNLNEGMALRNSGFHTNFASFVRHSLGDAACLRGWHRVLTGTAVTGDTVFANGIVDTDFGSIAMLAAIKEMGDQRQTSSVPVLIETLKSSRYPYARTYAAEALGGIGDARAITPLIEEFLNESLSEGKPTGLLFVTNEPVMHYATPVRIACAQSLGLMPSGWNWRSTLPPVTSRDLMPYAARIRALKTDQPVGLDYERASLFAAIQRAQDLVGK